MTEDEYHRLLDSVDSLTLELSDRLLDTDWCDASAVSEADRIMRVLYSYGRNIEKCIAMNKSHRADGTATPNTVDEEQLRDKLYRRLVRYADRIGKDELSRRLRDRGVNGSTERLDVLGKDGPASSNDD